MNGSSADAVHPRQRRPRLGIGGRALLSLTLAAAIPVLLFSGWVAYLTAQQQQELTRRAITATTVRVAEHVAAEIAAQVQVLEAEALSASLDRPDLGEFYTEAQRLKAAHPLWETIELTSPAGLQVVNLLRPLSDELGATADRRSFDEAVRTERTVVGGIGPVGPVSGQRLVALRAPVVRDAKLRYVLTVGLATNAVSAILRNAGAPEDWIGVIVDRYGNIVARTRSEGAELGRPASPAVRAAIARAPEGFYTGETLEGAEVETVYRTLSDTGSWSVHFGIPTEALNAPIARSYYVLAGGSLLSLALGVGLAGLTARDIDQRRRGEQARMDLALRKSEEQGAIAIEAAELGVLCWDIDRSVVVGSERARTLLGLPASRSGSPDSDWSAAVVLAGIHPDDRPRLREALHLGVSQGASLDLEFRVARPGHPPRWVRIAGRVPQFDQEEGPHSLIYGVVADVEARKRVEAERSEFLRRLSEAQENEQRRIARELHDQVGQTVTGLSLGLKGLESLLEDGAGNNQAGNRVRWLQALVTEIGRDIHRAAVDLRPTSLDDLGLRQALETLLIDWSQRHSIKADLHFRGSDLRLPSEIETALYRIVQEALTNVLKHAQARSVSVVVERQSGALRMIIEDDGQGFALEDLDHRTEVMANGQGRVHLGLSGIRERLALLGGTLTLESAPGAGTTLFVRVPLPPSSDEAAQGRSEP